MTQKLGVSAQQGGIGRCPWNHRQQRAVAHRYRRGSARRFKQAFYLQDEGKQSNLGFSVAMSHQKTVLLPAWQGLLQDRSKTSGHNANEGPGGWGAWGAATNLGSCKGPKHPAPTSRLALGVTLTPDSHWDILGQKIQPWPPHRAC